MIAAYNEYCVPTIAEAIDLAITEGARELIVVPTMLVRGNSHIELEINETILEARQRHPNGDIRYAWHFEQEHLVSLSANQVEAHLRLSSTVSQERR